MTNREETKTRYVNVYNHLLNHSTHIRNVAQFNWETRPLIAQFIQTHKANIAELGRLHRELGL